MRPLYRATLKPRPATEWLNHLIYRPLAHLVVLALWPTRVRPEALVLIHTGIGLLAAWLVARGPAGDVPAALLLQLKTVLDNADGQLARAKGWTSELGRYLDTLGDFTVNVALFAALAARTGAWVEAMGALAILTLLLSWDYNLERLYRAARGEAFRPPFAEASGGPWLRGLQRAYRLLFAPQDAWVERLERAAFAWGSRGAPPMARAALAQLWWSPTTLTLAANLGLTTQLAIAGVFLALHQPRAYLTFVLLEAGYLGLVYVWRIWRLKNATLSLR
ncbi:CDP-alcohol phosphatidyltransferase family protein [Marinithermus hydrothermalis]|uniref:CDP-alcohol phosphatidyltransferase n=1 Tax=Marinithermus hydrothermalis (strain DSM 14884 / JCM 11576 / T1) TaxID=869210 RepID=F2NL74_MARHT|nr:CDP-alcohol phosphatidyltransferase family protein [Marinithermus hydrothermalis]AEB11477.1 CDP-alcohol phosphatidyltransferase [Marinithermus hydrothermalis DSM 14884]